YERGYLPIVTSAYETEGIRYRETAFAWKPSGETDGWDIAYVAFEATNLTKASRPAAVTAHVILNDQSSIHMKDGYVLDPTGAALLAAADDSVFQDDRVVWRLDLAPGATRRVFCKVPYLPDANRRVKRPSASDFDSVHQSAVAFWQGLLDKGAQIET